MFEPFTYRHRREILAKKMTGIGLFLGNEEVGMNFPDNPYPFFRQDSNFLYFFGIERPKLVGWIDFDEGEQILFGDEFTLDDFIWIGPHETLSDLAEKTAIHQVKPLATLQTFADKAQRAGRRIHFLPPYQGTQSVQIGSLCGVPPVEVPDHASTELIRQVVEQRSIKSAEEIEEIETALTVTADMHTTAMRIAKPGMTEAELMSKVYEIALAHEVNLAYPIILTVNGHILHNHTYHHMIKPGKMLLGDFGCESPLHYASDITRTFPTSANFSARQREIYEIVLKAEVDSIEKLQPGVRYLDVHTAASMIVAQGLTDLGLMKGKPEDAVEAGAHALFFPHGLGHMMGLDVHDMEGLGEDHVGYNDKIRRSDQFGLAYLRLAKELQEGYVLTVEPGIYFIPDLIVKWEQDGLYKEFINYSKLESYLDFSGIRIEDNVLITADGHKVLGPDIPKSVEDLEALRSQALG